MAIDAKQLGNESINFIEEKYTESVFRLENFGLTKREHIGSLVLARLAECDTMNNGDSLKKHCDRMADLALMYTDSFLEKLAEDNRCSFDEAIANVDFED
jgi:hypothetical protein